MNRTNSRIFVLLAMVMLIAGCASAGTRFTMEDVDRLKPGVSTVADAKRVLGEPNQVSSMGVDNQTLMIWSYAYAGYMGIGNESRSVGIIFDENGKMVKVSSRSQMGAGMMN